MSAPQDDAAIVAAMVRDFDFPRYAASLFAPEPQRRAMLAIAAFGLEIGRIADQVTQPLPGEVRLQWWSDAIEGTAHGGVTGHPVAAELLRAIDAHGLERGPLLAAIEAHKFDLYDEPMPNMAALEVYCDDTAGALIRGALGVFATDAKGVNAIRDAGRALGLARVLARLGHDAAYRRCFLPDDAMVAHDATRSSLLAGEDSFGLREIRNAMIEAARGHLERARAAIGSLSREPRPAFLPLATLRFELDALERANPFALVPPPSRLRTLAAQWWMMR